ncbi:MAG: hypothetical protein WCS56_04490 [Bacilli bacterium]
MNKNFKLITIIAIVIGLFIFVGCESKYAKDYSADQQVTIVDEMSNEDLAAKADEGQESAGDYFNCSIDNTFSAEELGDTSEGILTYFNVNPGKFEIVKYNVSLDVRSDSGVAESFEGSIDSELKLYYRSIGETETLTKEISKNVYITNQCVYMQVTTDDDSVKIKSSSTYEMMIGEGGQVNFGLVVTTLSSIIGEKGTDEKGNIIIQNVLTDDEGITSGFRIVLDSSGKLVFASTSTGNTVMNIAINYNKKTISFPDDLDSYEDASLLEMSPLTVFMGLLGGMM